MKPIRNSAKALIIQNGCLLVTQNSDPQGKFYLLPGGGQNPGESLHAALRRECQEELGIQVEPGELRYIREYIAMNHEFAQTDANVHQVEFMFECQILDESGIGHGDTPDYYQDGYAWLPLNELHAYRLYPKAIIAQLQMKTQDRPPIYLGDVN